MTKKEFNNTSFGKGDTAVYNGKEYPVGSVDFEEQLIGLVMEIEGGDNPEERTWVRCENVEFIPCFLSERKVHE